MLEYYIDMTDLQMLYAALIGLGAGLIPYVSSWLKAKFNKKTVQELKEELKLRQEMEDMKQQWHIDHQETKTMLDTITTNLEHIGKVHGFDPQDIDCKKDADDELERFRKEINADRVTVWSFHNGQYFASGFPQRKLTTVFEALPPDKEEISEYDCMRNELLSGFSVILKLLKQSAIQNKGGTPVYPGVTVYSACEKCPLFKACNVSPSHRPIHCVVKCNIDDLPMNSRFYRLMKNIGTKVWYGRMLCNDDGDAVGVITVLYTSDSQNALDFLQNYTQEWCDTCLRIAGTINEMRHID